MADSQSSDHHMVIDIEDNELTENDYATCSSTLSPWSSSASVSPSPALKAEYVMEARAQALKGLASFNIAFNSVIFIAFSLSVFTVRTLVEKDYCVISVEKYHASVLLASTAFTLYFLSASIARAVAFDMSRYKKIEDEKFKIKHLSSKVFFWKTSVTLLTSLVATAAFLVSLVFTIEMKVGLFSCQTFFIKCVIVSSCIFLGSASMFYMEPVVSSFRDAAK